MRARSVSLVNVTVANRAKTRRVTVDGLDKLMEGRLAARLRRSGLAEKGLAL